jgi:hypothetical protein
MVTWRNDQTPSNELDNPNQVDAGRGGRTNVVRSWPPPTPYLVYRLCVTRRLDLLMSSRVRDVRIPDMPPLC